MAWPDDLRLDGRQTILLHLIYCERVYGKMTHEKRG